MKAVNTLRLVRVKDPIKIEGVLTESAWTTNSGIFDFYQQDPKEGEPASEKTKIRVLFDDKNIYFAIRAFDSEPLNINARELVRDSSFSNDDKVEIILDTFHDRRNTFRFTFNPLGTQQDALITAEGRDVNLSCDAAWVSEGKRDGIGWTFAADQCEDAMVRNPFGLPAGRNVLIVPVPLPTFSWSQRQSEVSVVGAFIQVEMRCQIVPNEQSCIVHFVQRA